MLIGKRLSGRYKILRHIGGGGMARVYLAKDVILERDVAIKVLRYDFAEEDEFLRRFQREAQAASSLAHPNIVSIYDVGEEDGIHFIVMEYVDGMTLKEYIQRYAPVPYEQVLHMMGQMTAAVAFAHQHAIIHRDVKPHNMLVDEKGMVKMTDFGIAMAMSETAITQTNTVLGSVHYLSPEQARGGMATKKSDLYSLGIVMYELLTGHLPFSGETAVSIALKHLQAETPRVREMYPDIPQSVENIVMKATAKDPFHRYKNAEEMEDDLAMALDPARRNERPFSVPDDDEQTKAIPVIQDVPPVEKTVPLPVSPPPPEPPVPEKKKRRRFLWIPLLLIVATLIGLAVWAWLRVPADVVVPDTAGSTPESAAEQLIKEGFEIGDSEEEHSASIEEGRVIRTAPGAGRTAKEGSEVDLFISSGKERKEMLDYTGTPLEEARELLDEAGFRNIEVEQAHSEEEAGTVIAQEPEPGEQVIPQDEQIVLTVSAGLAKVTLQDLTGYTERSLEDYAEKNNMIINIADEQFSDDVPAGQVMEQSPSGGTDIEQGSTVDVTLSKGPEAAPVKTASVDLTIPYEPEALGEPQEVEIFIEDADNSMTAPYEKFFITEDTVRTIELTFEEGTKAGYKVTRDRVVIIDETVDEEE